MPKPILLLGYPQEPFLQADRTAPMQKRKKKEKQIYLANSVHQKKSIRLKQEMDKAEIRFQHNQARFLPKKSEGTIIYTRSHRNDKQSTPCQLASKYQH